MYKKSILISFLLLIVFGEAFAQVPQVMNYQGILKNNSGEVVADGVYEITFSIYAIEAGGTPTWEEIQNVNTLDGIFQVFLGSVNPIENLPESSAWLSITIEDDDEILPRKRITSAAYAMQSADSDRFNGLQVDEFLLKEDALEPFVISTDEIEFTIPQPNTWYDAKVLTITVDEPTQLVTYAHYLGFYTDGTLADRNFIQLTLRNSQNQTIDFGTKSYRSVGLVANIDTRITFSVNPGTYNIVLNARATQAKEIEDMYIELLGIPVPSGTKDKSFSVNSPGTISDIPSNRTQN